jgi:hypothetical protein
VAQDRAQQPAMGNHDDALARVAPGQLGEALPGRASTIAPGFRRPTLPNKERCERVSAKSSLHQGCISIWGQSA